eukprot:TRINITY_DN14230_c0_g1_i1.p1 TRINITY_DN14230_c0_g1~~TRINITY_DN14230_c0_g1_i1.p1  ORF type:complete len:200 (+),score=48.55 TRINITY_DN14230_c0_g1_i1:170-769(+)
MRFILFAALVSAVVAQNCCVPDAFNISSATYSFGMRLIQSVSIDYTLQALRTEESGSSNQTKISGTSWIFGPKNPTFPNTLFYLEADTGFCFSETYNWNEEKFCVPNPDWELVDEITLAGGVPANVWFNKPNDFAMALTKQDCTPAQYVISESSNTNFQLTTFYDFVAGPISPSVFKPCTPTSKNARATNTHFRRGFLG